VLQFKRNDTKKTEDVETFKKNLEEHLELKNKINDSNEKISKELIYKGYTKISIDGAASTRLPTFRILPAELCMKKFLGISIYGIVNENQNEAQIITSCFQSGCSSKGVDHVISSILLYLNENYTFITKKIIFQSDNCRRETCNHIFLCFWHYMCSIDMFEEIILITNLKGHTKSICDRYFFIKVFFKIY